MNILILSKAPRCYSTRRLKEACGKRGHAAAVCDTMRFSIFVERGEPDLFYKNRAIPSYDAAIPRIGPSISFFGAAVVRQLEQMGVFTLNSSQAISVSRDKLRASQIFSRHNIGLPETVFVKDKGSVLPAIKRLGGGPVIIKLLEGTQGVGVILADKEKIAQAIVETLHGAKQNVLIQRFVPESKGRDIRAFVVGDRVVAAMRRVAVEGEFRSNLHRGGRAEKVDLDPEYERTAIHAAQILGLRVAGVDMLESASGPQILEVNSSPGLEGIEVVTGVNVADEIVRLIEEQVMFPEVDLRQRLTLQAGYSIAEVPVTSESELAHKKIGESGLRERDVLVLSILRESVSIPNPLGVREILPGDTLVCFGKALTLKSLLPPKTAPAGSRRRR